MSWSRVRSCAGVSSMWRIVRPPTDITGRCARLGNVRATDSIQSDVRIGGIVFDCADPRMVVRFWRDATGFRVRHQPDEPEDLDQWTDDPDWVGLYDPEGRSPTLGFQRVPEGKVAKNRVHIDLHAPDEEREAERLRGLGARELWRSQDPEDPFIVLGDPEGNEFCVVRRQGEA
jgi:catechol 2,3-dioxygenase-like lactoylglutathione lyase family enzyme